MSKDKRSSKKKKRVFTQSRKEERNSINVRKKRKPKCASSLKNLKFIMPRREEGSSKRKKKIHQAQKGASALRQERSLKSASK